MHPAFVAAVVLALGGCQSDEPANLSDPQEYISFGTPALSGGPSRSTLVGEFGESAGQVPSFRVWGYCMPTQVGGTDDDTEGAKSQWNVKVGHIGRADVMDGVEVAVKSDGSTLYSSPKAWINADAQESYDYTYSFVAMANTGSATVEHTISKVSGTQHPRLCFEMPFANTGSSTSTDAALDPDEVPDALMATVFDRTRRMGKVPMTFNHILTGVRFRAVNRSGQILRVKRVTLSGRFYRTGYYAFGSSTQREMWVDDLNTSSYSGAFTVFSGDQTVADETSAVLGVNPGDPADALGSVLLLLPNPNGRPPVGDNDASAVYSLGDNKVITIQYTLTPAGGAESALKTGSTGTFSLHYVPSANTLHTANLTFTGDRVIVLFQADNNTNWESGSDNNIEIH
ncbi:MAG: hypothetical protein K2L66_08585 [Paramuribaculum sp.]|nr:hypothetical protein [Paramuribaculum sp.]